MLKWLRWFRLPEREFQSELGFRIELIHQFGLVDFNLLLYIDNIRETPTKRLTLEIIRDKRSYHRMELRSAGPIWRPPFQDSKITEAQHNRIRERITDALKHLGFSATWMDCDHRPPAGCVEEFEEYMGDGFRLRDRRWEYVIIYEEGGGADRRLCRVGAEFGLHAKEFLTTTLWTHRLYWSIGENKVEMNDSDRIRVVKAIEAYLKRWPGASESFRHSGPF